MPRFIIAKDSSSFDVRQQRLPFVAPFQSSMESLHRLETDFYPVNDNRQSWPIQQKKVSSGKKSHVFRNLAHIYSFPVEVSPLQFEEKRILNHSEYSPTEHSSYSSIKFSCNQKPVGSEQGSFS